MNTEGHALKSFVQAQRNNSMRNNIAGILTSLCTVAFLFGFLFFGSLVLFLTLYSSSGSFEEPKNLIIPAVLILGKNLYFCTDQKFEPLWNNCWELLYSPSKNFKRELYFPSIEMLLSINREQFQASLYLCFLISVFSLDLLLVFIFCLHSRPTETLLSFFVLAVEIFSSCTLWPWSLHCYIIGKEIITITRCRL